MHCQAGAGIHESHLVVGLVATPTCGAASQYHCTHGCHGLLAGTTSLVVGALESRTVCWALRLGHEICSLALAPGDTKLMKLDLHSWALRARSTIRLLS